MDLALELIHRLAGQGEVLSRLLVSLRELLTGFVGSPIPLGKPDLTHTQTNEPRDYSGNPGRHKNAENSTPLPRL